MIIYCSETGCGRKQHARGLCNKHYLARRKSGLPLPPKPTTEDLFWRYVDKTETCWLWMGSTRGGYGSFKDRQRSVIAHRFAYVLAFGDLAANLDVDHLCFNRVCVRPDHLRPTTRKQNAEHRQGARRDSSSGVRGVSREGKRWVGYVCHNYQDIRVGLFDTLEEAERAVIAKRRELFTHDDGMVA